MDLIIFYFYNGDLYNEMGEIALFLCYIVDLGARFKIKD
jgi:hypothetical protein